MTMSIYSSICISIFHWTCEIPNIVLQCLTSFITFYILENIYWYYTFILENGAVFKTNGGTAEGPTV